MTQPNYFQAYGGSAPENYEKYFVPVIGGPLAKELVDVAMLHPGERVLDVACGTGAVTRLVAERVGSRGTVVGVDINPGMLQVARTIAPHIRWQEASAESLPFPDESFDAVLCQLSLQFFDRSAALKEMRRVLAPRGRVILNVPGPTPDFFTVLDEALVRHVNPEAAGFVDRVFSLHDPAEVRMLLTEAGFREVTAEAGTRTPRLPAPPDFLWQYIHSTPIAGLVLQADDAARAALERDVVAGWQKFVADGGMTYDQGIVVATGRK